MVSREDTIITGRQWVLKVEATQWLHLLWGILLAAQPVLEVLSAVVLMWWPPGTVLGVEKRFAHGEEAHGQRRDTRVDVYRSRADEWFILWVEGGAEGRTGRLLREDDSILNISPHGQVRRCSRRADMKTVRCRNLSREIHMVWFWWTWGMCK